jgi:hypothetical protein
LRLNHTSDLRGLPAIKAPRGALKCSADAKPWSVPSVPAGAAALFTVLCDVVECREWASTPCSTSESCTCHNSLA